MSNLNYNICNYIFAEKKKYCAVSVRSVHQSLFIYINNRFRTCVVFAFPAKIVRYIRRMVYALPWRHASNKTSSNHDHPHAIHRKLLGTAQSTEAYISVMRPWPERLINHFIPLVVSSILSQVRCYRTQHLYMCIYIVVCVLNYMSR